MLHRLTDGVQRWRHRSGFGVHSPFAFRVVNEMLRPSYPYYNTAKLRLLLRQENMRKLSREYELIFRIVARTGLRHAIITPDSPKALERVLGMAGGGIVVSRGILTPGDAPVFIYDDRASLPYAAIAAALGRDGSCALLRCCSEEIIKKVCSSQGEGLILRNRSSLLIFSRKGMAVMNYEMRF